MLKNYFKIAFRNLWKNKGYSALNIFGLAIGITCASFIFLWVEDEMNFDESIPDKDLVFNIPTNQLYDGEWRTFFVATPGPLGEVLKTEIPEIDKSARIRDRSFLFTVGDEAINAIIVRSMALITVSFQAIEAAIANPVRTLRTE